MLDDIAGTYGSRFFLAAGGVGLALLCLVGILWLVRNRPVASFVRISRSRHNRLQVVESIAIDARRRLVLLRRDEIEHLVLVGGPTDLVIENSIGKIEPETASFNSIFSEQEETGNTEPENEAVSQ